MISIVTPVFNCEKYLEKCILSIISQTYTNYEHIIVDGGSTDGTLDIIKKYEGKYNMHWISEPDKGMYDAIAKGFRMSKGDVLCWLNSDDMYMPWTLQVVADTFYTRKVQWVTGIASQINEKGHCYVLGKSIIIYPQFCIKRGWMDSRRIGCVQQESTFWSRKLYEQVNGIDSKYKLAGDHHLWKSFAQKEKLYTVNSLLATFRVHSEQKSSDKIAYFNEEGKISKLQEILIKCKFYRIVNIIYKRLQSNLLIGINK